MFGALFKFFLVWFLVCVIASNLFNDKNPKLSLLWARSIRAACWRAKSSRHFFSWFLAYNIVCGSNDSFPSSYQVWEKDKKMIFFAGK